MDTIVRYRGPVNPQIQNQIYGFLESHGFGPHAFSTTQGSDGNGELKYFIRNHGESPKSKLEASLGELNLEDRKRIEILEGASV